MKRLWEGLSGKQQTTSHLKKKMHKAIQYEGSIERRENKLCPGGNSGL